MSYVRGDCPLHIGANLIFSGQNVNQETHWKFHQGKLSWLNHLVLIILRIAISRLVNSTGEPVVTSALIDDMQAFTVMNQHQLSNDGNSLILVKLDEGISPGDYNLQMMYNETIVDELNIYVPENTFCSITDKYPNGILSPTETPSWIIGSHDSWDGSSNEWNVVVEEGWSET